MATQILLNRWDVVIVDQDDSRSATNPNQPLDTTKNTRRFIVLNQRDSRYCFNCIECVSRDPKKTTQYPDVEIKADQRLFVVDSIARTGMIYTLRKDSIKRVLGTLTLQTLRQKISIGLGVYLPLDPTKP